MSTTTSSHRAHAVLAISLLVLAACAASLLALAACANILAIDGPITTSVTDAGVSVLEASTVACGLAAGSPTCQACLEASCCAQAATCAASGGCAAYESCNIPCGADYACRAGCQIEYASNDPAVPAVSQCLAANCETECGIECGLGANSTEPDAAAGCQECIVANACQATQSCFRNLSCAEIAACEATCTTPDCQDTCLIGQDAGAALAQAAATAVASQCLSPCQYGEHWECLGKSLPGPIAKASVIQLTLTVLEVPTGAPVLGANIIACNVLDPQCDAPVASGTTSATGQTTLAIPTTATGFGGHLELTGTGLMRELYFFAYALSEPTFSLQVTALTPATFAEEVSPTNVTPDPTLGSVLVETFDCSLQNAANVSVGVDGAGTEAKLFYAVGALLSTQATSTQGTDLALLVNAQPGTVSFTATSLAVNRVSSRASVIAKAGSLSYVSLIPN